MTRLGYRLAVYGAHPWEVEMLIIVARELASFCQFLKPRQEAKGWSLVLLDRRTPPDRLPAGLPSPERRMPTPPAAAALMSVLGFMVLHRVGKAWLP